MTPGADAALGLGAARLRTWPAAAILVVTCLLRGSLGGAAGSSDVIDTELIGFLAQLPRDGLRLPPAAPATATLEVPNELGGPRLIFPLEFTPRTGVAFHASHLRGGELVVLEGVLQGGRVLVRQVRDVEVAEFRGRVSLPDGPVSLPPTADQLVGVLLDGASLTITFLLTPQMTSPRTTLHDGQPVSLAVVVGRRLVVDLEMAKPR